MLLILKWKDSVNELRELSVDLSSLEYVYIGRLDRELRELFSIDDVSSIYVFNIDKKFIQDMNVRSRKVSRRHVLIKLISDRLIIMDHGRDGSGSTYGTYVDGVRLRKGSSIAVHGSKFKLRIADLDIEINVVNNSSMSSYDVYDILNIVDKIFNTINDMRIQVKYGVPAHLLSPHVVALEDLVKFFESYLSRIVDKSLVDYIFKNVYDSLNNVKKCVLDLEDNPNDPVLLNVLDRSLVELKGHVEALDNIVRGVVKRSSEGRI
ncbi:MAG: FHA domain-containing protein [Crenarchaeota archaeon]|nr:FHA domain-containing protein [Thermoproteota archaeon]